MERLHRAIQLFLVDHKDFSVDILEDKSMVNKSEVVRLLLPFSCSFFPIV